MNRYKQLGILFVILMFPSLAIGAGNAQLELWKRSEFLYGPCGHCADLITIKDNKNWADFTPYDIKARDGYFTANLNGPAGTQVTLYGLEDFRKKQGYLIIIKKDDSAIEIEDFTAFAPGIWTEVDKETGSYSAFYQPHQNFKSSVSSVKWGKWWSGSIPTSQN
ncbi:MAG: hypothetical protein HOK41_10915 [Nitrospina sp.]|jgi:hypothetical protein|nr:hypothetical protein [Nitrospina sp.]